MEVKNIMYSPRLALKLGFNNKQQTAKITEVSILQETSHLLLSLQNEDL